MKMKFNWLASMLVVMMLVMPTQMFAAGGNGGGNGSGGGNGTGGGNGSGNGSANTDTTQVEEKTVALESSTPENGATEIALDGEIILTFSNNVVNMKVADANKGLFHLVDSKGNELAIDVVMADDQVEPEKKREVTIKPLASLEANQEYKVIVDAGVQAKNGAATAEAYEIGFTTVNESSNTLFYVGIAVAVVLIAGAFILFRKKQSTNA